MSDYNRRLVLVLVPFLLAIGVLNLIAAEGHAKLLSFVTFASAAGLIAWLLATRAQ